MPSKILSLEISEHLVKACVINSQSKHGCKMHDAFMFPTPEGAISDGQLTNIGSLASVIRLEMEKHELKNIKGLAFTLQSGKIAAREIRLPLIKESRIKSVVETNASEYFPVDMSKYHITYALLERIEEQPEPGLRVMVYAVPMTILDNYFQLAELLELPVIAIDYSGNSLFASVKNLSEEKVTLYAYVDVTSSCVIVVKNHTLMLQRYFPCGCDELANTYMQTRGLEDGKYFGTLTDMICDRLMNPPEESEIADGCTRITGNIERIVDYYNSGHIEAPIEHIVLTGTCCKIRGLLEHISGSISIPTTEYSTLTGFSVSTKITDFPCIYMAPAAVVIAPLDLIPEKYAKKKKQRDPNSLVIPIAAVITALAIGGALSVSAVFQYLMARDSLNEIERKISSLEYAEEVYLRYSDYVASADGFRNLENYTESSNKNLVNFIEELEDKMPPEISVLSASFSDEGVSMNVVVLSKEAAAEVIAQLRTFQSISVISVSAISQSSDESLGVDRVYFSVNCIYGVNPYYPAETAN